MKRNLKKCIFLLPFFIGVAGFLTSGMFVLDALFQSIEMYFLNYSDTPPNILVELARWLAPLATASGILLVLSKVHSRIQNYIIYRRGNSIAVYGPQPHRQELLNKLGKRGINAGDYDSSNPMVRAQDYLLLGEQTETIKFYTVNRQKLLGHTVYLQAELPAQSVSDSKLRLFCPEETTARLYWKQRDIYEISTQNNHHIKIVFVGFGTLGQQLLTYALLDNIFDPDQTIEYHIFGDSNGKYAATHSELDKINDPVIFHTEQWYEDLHLLEEANLVLVCEQIDQFKLVQSMLSALTVPEIDVFTADGVTFDLLEGKNRLRPYPWQQYAWNPCNIFNSTMFDQAMELNLNYAHLYNGIVKNSDNREAEWAKLDGFTRYSNVSAADYHEVRLHMIKKLGWSEDGEKLNIEQLEFLAELEHIRWCRYHQLNNWKLGTPENGNRKDPANRIHLDLIPYADLTETAKQKDRENILLLLSFLPKK